MQMQQKVIKLVKFVAAIIQFLHIRETLGAMPNEFAKQKDSDASLGRGETSFVRQATKKS